MRAHFPEQRLVVEPSIEVQPKLPPILLRTGLRSMMGGGVRPGVGKTSPLPINPDSYPKSRLQPLCGFLRLRNIAQSCVIFPYLSRFPSPVHFLAYGYCARGTSGSQNRGVLKVSCRCFAKCTMHWVLVSDYGSECYN